MKIYLCPALMDTLIFLVTFAVMYRAGDTARCAWLAGLHQVVYMLSSLAAGWVLTRRNARFLLLASTALSLVLGSGCLIMERFGILLAAYGGLGVCMAVFFNSFQTFMRSEAPPGGLGRSIGLYTLAWSLGASAGTFGSGLLYQLSFRLLIVLNALIGLAILAILAGHRAKPMEVPAADEQVETMPRGGRPVDPLYVGIGWIMIFMAMFLQRPLFSYYPAINAKAGIGAFITGLPLFLQMAIQGLFGLSMSFWRRLLYRRLPLSLAHGGAALLLLALWRWPTPVLCGTGIAVLGFYSGFVYFSSVYYASNSGRRNLNIGVNEFLVGLGSFGGLFLCEWAIRRTGCDASMYLVISLALLAALAAQLVLTAAGRAWREAGRRRPEAGD